MTTVNEWLKNLSKTSQSSDKDSQMMENLLHRIGYPGARVVAGIAYLGGQRKPIDIHSVARACLSWTEEELAS